MSDESDVALAEFIQELAEQEGITFHQAAQLAIKTIKECAAVPGK